MTISTRVFITILGLFLLPGFSQANEITLQHKGLTLNASLDLATNKKISDGIVLITHGGLAHRDMETLTYFRSLLNARGYNTLAINLGLGIDNRHEMYDCNVTHKHRHTDAAEEIVAWVEWLKKQNVNRIALLGHSRGAAQTALYAAEHNNPSIKAVMLLAPDTKESNDPAAYLQRHKKPLTPILSKAQNLVDSGKGETLLKNTDFLYCTDTTVSAHTFVAYYAPNPKRDTATLLTKINAPTLIINAGDDESVINNKQYEALADGKRLQVVEIEGAGHFFQDLHADDAADVMQSFLKSVTF